MWVSIIIEVSASCVIPLRAAATSTTSWSWRSLWLAKRSAKPSFVHATKTTSFAGMKEARENLKLNVSILKDDPKKDSWQYGYMVQMHLKLCDLTLVSRNSSEASCSAEPCDSTETRTISRFARFSREACCRLIPYFVTAASTTDVSLRNRGDANCRAHDDAISPWLSSHCSETTARRTTTLSLRSS